MKSIGRAIKIDKLKNGASLEPTEIKEKLRTLTPREIEIADLIAKGLLNREVAEITGISIRTVETHRGRIFISLELRTSANLFNSLISFLKSRLLIRVLPLQSGQALLPFWLENNRKEPQ